MRRPTTVRRVLVHVAGPLERREVPLLIEQIVREDVDLTHEVRCLRCDQPIPGTDWKLGERVAEDRDDNDTIIYRPTLAARQAGETDCRPA